MAMPTNHAAANRVRQLYEKGPYTDHDMAEKLGMPRTTVTMHRNKLGLPPVGYCKVCKKSVPARTKYCDEHRKTSPSATGRQAFLEARTIGLSLLELNRYDQPAFQARIAAMRSELGTEEFQRRYAWVEKAAAEPKKERSKPAPAQPAEPPIPFMPAKDIFGPDAPEPKTETPLHAPTRKPLEDYLGDAKPLAPTPNVQWNDDALSRHRARCKDAECGCHEAPAQRPVQQPPAASPPKAPPAPQSQDDGSPFEGLVVLRNRVGALKP